MQQTLRLRKGGGNTTRKIRIQSGGGAVVRAVTTVGGPTTVGLSLAQLVGFVDGSAAVAKFNSPNGVVVESTATFLYVADFANNRVRRISIDFGAVGTLAGGAGEFLDATGTAARFRNPYGIVIDPTGTNLYVTDSGNHRIRQIVIASGAVSTLAGSGTASSVNGAGTAATFNNPFGIAIDSTGTNLYVAENNGHRIRRIVIASREVSTLAGSGSAAFADGAGTAASFNAPAGVTIDSTGTNLYVSDGGNCRVRRIVIGSGAVSTLAGSGSAAFADGAGTAASFNRPTGIAIDPTGTKLYVSDAENDRIRQIVIGSGLVSTLAGSGVGAFLDGTATAARFDNPSGMSVDSEGNIYLADANNHRIRKIAITPIATITGITTNAAGTGASIALTPPDARRNKTITGYTYTAAAPLGGTGIASTAATGTTSPLTIAGLTPGTKYTIAITAVYSDGASAAPSAGFDMWTAPAAPTALTLTNPQPSPNNSAVLSITLTLPTFGSTPARVTSTTGTSPSLTLTPFAAAVNGAHLVVYSLTATPTGGAAVTHVQNATNANTNVIQLSGLSVGVTYSITAKAEIYSYNSSGASTLLASSNNSTALSYTVPIPPPTSVALVPLDSTRATVSWTPPTLPAGVSITSYTYTLTGNATYANKGSAGAAAPTITGTISSITSPQTITGLLAGAGYRNFTLQPVGTAGSTFQPANIGIPASAGNNYTGVPNPANPFTSSLAPHVSIGMYGAIGSNNSSTGKSGYNCRITSVTSTTIGYTKIGTDYIQNPASTFSWAAVMELYALIMPVAPVTFYTAYTPTSSSLAITFQPSGATDGRGSGSPIPTSYSYTLTPTAGGSAITGTVTPTYAQLNPNPPIVPLTISSGLSSATDYSLVVTGLGGVASTTASAPMLVSTLATAPGTLVVSSYPPAGTSITISFVAPPIVGAITSYRFSATTPNISGTLTNVISAPGSGLATVAGLTPGTVYSGFTIAAVSAGGTSTPSTSIGFVTCPLPPTNLARVSNTDYSASFSFTAYAPAATSPAAINAARPYVYTAVSSTGAPTITGTFGTTVSATAAAPQIIHGCSFVGSMSGSTLTVTTIIGGIITLGSTISGSGISAGTTIVSYGTASAANGVGTYNINNSQTVSSTSMSTGILPGHTYTVTLQSNDSALQSGVTIGGLSVPSNAVTFTMLPPSPQNIAISGTRTSTSATLSWTLPFGAALPLSYAFTSPTIPTLTPINTNYTTSPYTASFANLPSGSSSFINITTTNNVWQDASVVTPPLTQSISPGTITGYITNTTLFINSVVGKVLTGMFITNTPLMGRIINTGSAAGQFLIDVTQTVANPSTITLSSYRLDLPPTKPTMSLVTSDFTNSATTATLTWTGGAGGTHYAFYMQPTIAAVNSTSSVMPYISYLGTTTLNSTNMSVTAWTSAPNPSQGIVTGMYIFGLGLAPNTRVSSISGSTIGMNQVATQTNTNAGVFTFSMFPQITSPVTFGRLPAGQNVNFAMVAINQASPMGIDSGWSPAVAVPSIAAMRQIYTQKIAGSASAAFTDGNIVASFNAPNGIAVDSAGNIYVADRGNHRIRKITNTGSGSVVGVTTTIAGTGAAGATNGPGVSATFNSPHYLALNSAGTVLYVSDTGNNVIRKIDLTSAANTVSTFATGFNSPQGICVDPTSGAVYVADVGSHRILRLTSSGTIVAFTGVNASIGYVDGPLSTAKFNAMKGIAINSTGDTIYVGDTGNNLVRVIRFTPLPIDSTTANTGTVATIAGGNTLSISGFGVGSGLNDTDSINSFGVSAFNAPSGLTIDTNGNIYVADSSNHRIRKITPGGYVTTVGGFNPGARTSIVSGYADGDAYNLTRFNAPSDVAVDSNGNLFVADMTNNRIRKIAALVPPTSMMASPVLYKNPKGLMLGWGGGTVPGVVYTYSLNGATAVPFTPAAAPLLLNNLTANTPYNITVTATTTSSVTSTFSSRTDVTSTPTYFISTMAGAAASGSADGVGFAASFLRPAGCVYDNFGNLYVADSGNHTIRMMPYGTNNIVTIAGLAGSLGATDGTGTTARFNSPFNVAADSANNIYVADTSNHKIRRIALTFATGSTTTLTSAVVTTVAGSTQGNSDNANPLEAKMNSPRGIFVAPSGLIYIADSANSRIRILSANGLHTLTDISGAFPGNMYNLPTDFGVDVAGNMYFINNQIHTITKYNPSLEASIFVGTGATGFSDATGKTAAFNRPYSMIFDPSGNMIITDTDNNRIRRITPFGEVTTIAGNATSGWADGIGTSTSTLLNGPYGIAINPIDKTMCISDTANHRLRMMTRITTPPTPANVTVRYKNHNSVMIDWTESSALGVTYAYTISPQPSPYDTPIMQSSPVVFTRLSPNTGYTITITASNPAGTSAAASISFTTLSAYNSASLPYNPATMAPYIPGRYVSLYAGSSSNAGLVNGNNLVARFNDPRHIARDAAGNIYVADRNNNCVRMITPAGVVSTLAGAGTAGSAEGAAATATFSGPTGILVNSAGTILYVSDTGNHKIRKITGTAVAGSSPVTYTWTVSTLAGSGTAADANVSNDGTGAAARFSSPQGICFDNAGNIIVADTNIHRIRRVTPDGVVTSLGGWASGVGLDNGIGAGVSFNGPRGVAADGFGNIYVADTGNNCIRRINSAGKITRFIGKTAIAQHLDGAGDAATFNAPCNIVYDNANMLLYVFDAHHSISMATLSGVATTIAGTPSGVAASGGYQDSVIGQIASGVPTGGLSIQSTKFNLPMSLVMDSIGNMYVSEPGNGCIRLMVPVPLPTKPVVRITSIQAGAVVADWTGGGNMNEGIVFSYALKLSDGNLVGTQPTGQTKPVTFLTTNRPAPETYNVTISATNGMMAVDTKLTSDAITVATPAYNPTTVSVYAGTTGSTGNTDGRLTAARFSSPAAMAVDRDNNIYIADMNNSRIRMISNTGVVTTIAGNGTSSSVDGVGTAATVNKPSGIAVDGNGVLYLADTNGHRIRRLVKSGSTWTVTTIAGSGTASVKASGIAAADGVGTSSTFNTPNGIAVNAAGTNIYVADTGNHMIRRITLTGGSVPSGPSTPLVATVTTIAGIIQTTGLINGAAVTSQFNNPYSIAVSPDESTIYVADSNNNKIRLISNGIVSNFVNTNTGADIVVAGPRALYTDSTGNLFIADTNNHRIIKVNPSGGVLSVAGPTGVGSGTGSANGTAGAAQGSGVSDATFNTPSGIAVNLGGTVYVADTNNQTIRMISYVGSPGRPVPTYSNLTGTSVTISWAAVAQAARSSRGVTYSYTMPPYTNDTIVNATSPLTITGLTPGTIYTMTLSAVDDGGSSDADPFIFTTLPPAPTPVVVSLLAAGPNYFTIGWTGAQYATSYTYRINGATVLCNSQGSNTATFTGLPPGTSNSIIVNATNITDSTPSSPFTVILPPSQPVLTLTVTAPTSLTASWTGGVGATSYAFSITPSTGITLPTTQTSPAVFIGLTSGSSYMIGMTATNSAGTTSAIPIRGTTSISAPPDSTIPRVMSTIYTGGLTGATPTPNFNVLQMSADNTTLYSADNSTTNAQKLQRLTVATNSVNDWITTNSGLNPRDFLGNFKQMASDSFGNIYMTSLLPYTGSVIKWRAADNTMVIIAGACTSTLPQNMVRSGYTINTTYSWSSGGSWPVPISLMQMNSVQIVGTITLDAAGRYILTVTNILGGAVYKWDASQGLNTQKVTNSTTVLDDSTMAKKPIIYPGMAVGLSVSAATVNGVRVSAVPPFSPFVGSINGSTLTVTSMGSGSLTVGTIIGGPSVPQGTRITAMGANTNGTAGTYTLSQSTNIAAVTPCVFSGYFTSASSVVTLIVTGIISGTLAVNMWVSGPGLCPGAYISAFGTGSGRMGSYTVAIPIEYAATPGLYGPSTNILNTATSTETPLLGTVTSPVALIATSLAGLSYIQKNDTIPCVIQPPANPPVVTDNQAKWGVVITEFLTGNGGVGTYVVSNVMPGTPLYGLTTSTSPTLAIARGNNGSGLGVTPFSVPTALTCAGFISGNTQNNTLPQIGNAVTSPTGICVDPTGNAVYVIENGGGGGLYGNNVANTLRKFVRMQGINPADEIWRSYILTPTGSYSRDGYGIVSSLPGTSANPAANSRSILSSTAAWGEGIPNTNNDFLFGQYNAGSPPVVTGGSLNYPNAPNAVSYMTPQTTLQFVMSPNATVKNLYAFGGTSDVVNLAIDPTNPDIIYVLERNNRRVLKLRQGANNTLTVGLFAGDIGRVGYTSKTPVSVARTLDGVHIWYDGSGATVASFGSVVNGVVDKYGFLFVGDGSNKCIRMISPAGIVTTIVGGSGLVNSSNTLTTMDSANPPPLGQVGMNAGLFSIMGLAVDSNRTLYLSDSMGNNGPSKIRKIAAYTEPLTITRTLPSTPQNINNNYVLTTLVSKSTTVTAGSSTVAIFPLYNSTYIDGGGNVYFYQSSSYSVYKISAASIAASTTPSPVRIAGASNANKCINYETGLATNCALGFVIEIIGDDAGNLYILDTINNITTDGMGNINTPSMFQSSIRKLTLITTGANTGSYMLSNIITWPQVGFVGITISKTGNLLALCLGSTNTSYTTDGIYTAGIYRIPLDGSMLTQANIIPITGAMAAGNYLPTIVCDPNTDVIYCAYVGNGNIVYKLTPTTAAGGSISYVASVFMQNMFSNVAALCIDSGGILYVADSNRFANTSVTPNIPIGGPGRVYVMNPNGTTNTIVQLNFTKNQGAGLVNDGMGGSVGTICDMAIDSTGQFIITDCLATPSAALFSFRKFGFVSYTVGTTAGSAFGYANSTTPTLAQFRNPSAVIFDSAKNQYVVDQTNHCIRKITPAGVVTLFAGRAGVSGYADGGVNTALFNQPTGIAIDTTGVLYVTDTNNHCIRKIDSTGAVTTFAGLPDVAYFNPTSGCNITGTTLTIPNYANPVISNPQGLSGLGWVFGVPIPDMFVAPPKGTTGTTGITGITTTTSTTSPRIVNGMTVHGPGVTAGTRIVSGPTISGTNVRYTVNISQTVTSTSGFTFVGNTPTAGYVNMKWYPATGYTSVTTHNKTYNSTSAHPAVKFNSPTGIICDSGLTNSRASFNTLYIADTGNNCIRAITLINAGGTSVDVSTFSGPPTVNPAFSTATLSVKGPAGAADRTAAGVGLSTALYRSPRDLTELWYTPSVGPISPIIFVADTGNNCIRAIVMSGVPKVFTILGNGSASSRLSNINVVPTSFTPSAIDCDINGNIYFADLNTHTLYSYTSGAPIGASGAYVPVFGDGIVGYIAGNPVELPFYTDGDNAAFNIPMGFTFMIPATKGGGLYLCDYGNNRVRNIKFKTGVLSSLQLGLGKIYFPYDNTKTDVNQQPGILDEMLMPGMKKFYDISNNVYVYFSASKIVSRPSVVNFKAVVDTIISTNIEADRARAASAAQASSAVQQRASSAVQQQASSAVQQQASSAVQQQASSAVQQQASSAVQQQASSAVQQQASSAVQQQASSAVQQRASSAVQQQAFSTTSQATASEATTSQATVSTGGGITQQGGAITSIPLPTSLSITTIAGLPLSSGVATASTSDGVGRAAGFNNPQGITFDTAGNVYITDTVNNRIRKITKATSGGVTTWTVSTLNNTVNQLSSPMGVSIDTAGTTLYIADTYNHCIRRFNLTTNVLSVFAGSSGTAGWADGAGSAARFFYPSDISVTPNGIYVTDTMNNCIRKLDNTGYTITIAGASQNLVPVNTVSDPVTGSLISFGYPSPGATDGEAFYSAFNSPFGITHDTNNNIYIADSGNNCVRKINSNSVVVTVAGDLEGQAAGVIDGVGSIARFSSPTGIAAYGDSVYVSDAVGTIRILKPVGLTTSGFTNMMAVTTVAGTGYPLTNIDGTGPLDGVGPLAGFNTPSSIAINKINGDILITDTGNNSIRYASQQSMMFFKAPDVASIPVDAYGTYTYTKQFESTLRRHIYVSNTTGLDYTSISAPIRANGTKQAAVYNDRLTVSPTQKTWELWRDTTASSLTNGLKFYYSPMTGEVVWDLPASALPVYPPVDGAGNPATPTDTSLSETCFTLKYQDSRTGNPYYMNLLTTEYSWDAPTCPVLIAYPAGRTLEALRASAAAQQTASSAQQQRASSAVQQAASSAEQQRASSAVQQQASSAVQQTASSAQQQTASSATQQRASSAEQQRASSAVQQQASSAMQQTASSAEQQRASSAEQQRASSAEQQRASSAVQQQASSAMQQTASSAEQQRASSAEQQRASSAVQQQASSAVQQQASSAVQQAASSAEQQTASSATQQQASSAEQQRASSAVQQEASSAVQQAASSAEQQTASSATQQQASSAEQQRASSAVQQEASSAVQQAASSAEQQTASSATQQQASSAEQQRASSAVQQEASSAVQQTASSAEQQQASSAVQQTASSAEQQQASSAVQQTASSAEQQQASSATQQQASSAEQQQASSAVQQTASSAEQQQASSAVQQTASSAEQQQASSAVQQTASSAEQQQASSAVQQTASSAEQQQASSAVQQTASSAEQQQASSAVQQTASSAEQQTASSAEQQQASSAVQQTASSAEQQQASSAVQQTASSAEQQTASSAEQQQASSAVQQTASSAVQQTASSAEQQQASSAVQQTASSAEQQQASSAVQQTASSAEQQTASSAEQQQASSAVQQTASSAEQQQASSAVQQTASSAEQQQTASSAVQQEASSAVQQTASSAVQQQASQAQASQAQASAAQFSGAIQSYVSTMANNDVAVSAAAVNNLAQLVLDQVQLLVAAGSYEAASNLLIKTLEQIRASVAFLSNDPATIDMITTLITRENAIMSSIPISSASAAQASAANLITINNLQSPDIATSIGAASTITADTITQANRLLAFGSYSSSETLITQVIAQLNGSPAANTPEVQEYISQLTALLNRIQSLDPTIRAATASQAVASQAVASSAVQQGVSAAQASQAMASQAVASSAVQQGVSAAQASQAVVVQASQAMASQALASSAVEQGVSAAQASQAMASQALASSAVQQGVSSAQASQAQASAAQFSGAIQSYVSTMANADIPVSSAAVNSLAQLVLDQIQILVAAGSYEAAANLLIKTLEQIRESVAFLSNDPATLNIVNTLVTRESAITSSIPVSSASAAQASAANVVNTANLQSPDIATSISAASIIKTDIMTQANRLLALGSYSSAETLLAEVIAQLNSSTGANTPEVQEYISQLTALLNRIESINPTIRAATASQAVASQAVASSAVEQGVSAAQASQAVASQELASSAVEQGVSAAQASQAVAAEASQAQASAAAPAIAASAAQASQAQASAAQQYYTTALQSTNIQTSVDAAKVLVSSVASTVQSLVAAGSYSAAMALITEMVQALNNSSAYTANNPELITLITTLNVLAQQVQQANPGAQASAAQASAAQAYYTNALQNTDIATSVAAAKSMIDSVQSTIQLLITIGSFSVAASLIADTINIIQSSTAFRNNNSEVVALIATLQTLATTTAAQNPATRITSASSARQVSAAQTVAPTPTPGAAPDPAILAALLASLMRPGPITPATPAAPPPPPPPSTQPTASTPTGYGDGYGYGYGYGKPTEGGTRNKRKSTRKSMKVKKGKK
jgi:sugar lactone lactonase YvrE